MAQGKLKMTAAKKSAGAVRRKAVKAKTKVTKGRRALAPRAQKAIAAKRDEDDIRKDINRKNEAIISARAMAAGTTSFFLGEVKDSGKKEIAKQTRQRNHKELRQVKMTERLRAQLNKLEYGTTKGGGSKK